MENLQPHGFLQDLALVLMVAAVTTVLFQRLKQPVVLGYLLEGLIVGPHIPIPLFVVVPGGDEVLRAGDVVALLGSEDASESAMRLLTSEQ